MCVLKLAMGLGHSSKPGSKANWQILLSLPVSLGLFLNKQQG